MTILDKPLPPTPVLETQRLILRPLRPAGRAGHPAPLPALGGRALSQSTVPWPYPDDGASRFIAICLGEMARGEKHHWSIRLKDGPDELIGSINLWPDDGVSRDQRGFWLDPAFQGQGLMTEAADRVTDYAFRDLGWPHLWLSNAEANRASAPHQGEARRTAGRLRARRYVGGEGTRMVWLLSARTGRPAGSSESVAASARVTGQQ